MSILKSVLSMSGALKKVVDMVFGVYRYRTDKRRRLLRLIEINERRLAKALQEGRVSDAGALATERRRLYEKLGGIRSSKEVESNGKAV